MMTKTSTKRTKQHWILEYRNPAKLRWMLWGNDATSRDFLTTVYEMTRWMMVPPHMRGFFRLRHTVTGECVYDADLFPNHDYVDDRDTD